MFCFGDTVVLLKLTVFVGNITCPLGTMSQEDSDIDPIDVDAIDALNDNSTISTPSRPLPASINTVWDHPLIELVHIPGTPGKSDGYYWHCRAEGCGKKANGKNATKALAHGARDFFS